MLLLVNFCFFAFFSLGLTQVLVISGRGGRCAVPVGDYFISLFMISALNWSNRHGYDFKMRTNHSFLHLNNHYAKIGHLMEEMQLNLTSEKYKWIMWLDNDTLVTNPQDSLPLGNLYGEYDIIMEGNWKEFEASPIDMYQALNTGVILMRICQASLEFLQELVNCVQEDISSQLVGKFINWESLQDQKIITWMLWKNPGKWKVFLDQRTILNGYWTCYPPSLEKRPLIKHWAGCKFCERGDISEEKRGKCIADFMASWRTLNLGE